LDRRIDREVQENAADERGSERGNVVQHVGLPRLVELIEPGKHNRCLKPAGALGETLMSDETQPVSEADCVLCRDLDPGQ
jgi:hypothetical protein